MRESGMLESMAGFGGGIRLLTVDFRPEGTARSNPFNRTEARVHMKLRGGCLLILWALAAPSAAGSILYDAESDYIAGWIAGTNPNGVWTYGWSTSPGNNVTLYTTHDQLSGFPSFDEWKDPSNNINATPLVYSNQSGSSFSGGGAANLDSVPAGALIIHGGGTAASCGSDGGCFSEVIWTAPSTDDYSLVTTFAGHQLGMTGLVEVLKVTGGAPSVLFSNSALTDGTSVPFDQIISVLAGDQIIFAARTSDGSLNPDTTQLQATLTAVPEPSSLVLLGGAMLALAGLRRIRSRERLASRVVHDQSAGIVQ